MSQENVDRFLEGADAFNRGDLDAASDWLGPEVVFEPQAAALEGNAAGPDGVRTFMAGLRDLFEVFEVRYTDVRDLGDRVLALGTTRSVARGSGIEQEFTLAVVATYKDGLLTHWKDYGVGVQRHGLAAFDEFRFESEELIDLGDGRLVTVGRMKGSGLSSGAAFDTDWAAMFTLSAGRVIREQIFLDRDEALEAAGLRE